MAKDAPPAKKASPAKGSKAAAPAKKVSKPAAAGKGPAKAKSASKGAAKAKSGSKGAAKAKGSSKGPAVKKAKVDPKAGAKGAAKKGGKADVKKPHSKFHKLYYARPKVFGIGRDLPPRRDVSRFVKWPRYIRLQRQKTTLLQRLKIPPTLNQFNRTLDRSNARALFKLLHQYRPESTKDRKARLQRGARKLAEGDRAKARPTQVVTGVNSVTRLIEKKKAELVVIANDVDPIELVVWLPTLCRKVDVPYVIVKDKARLGVLTGSKTTTVVALPKVKPEHQAELKLLTEVARETFNDNVESRRHWGGGKLGPKSLAQIRKKQKLIAKEQLAVAKS